MRKNSLKPIIYIILVVLAIVLLVRHFHIKDFCVMEPKVLYTSGQPRGMDYTRLLYNYHIATIVNIRLATEQRERNWHTEEIDWTRDNSVKYIEIPIGKNMYFPDKQIQDKFLSIMSDPNNLPVLLHGGGDDKRVAMLVAAWFRRVRRLSSQETIALVKKVIDDRPLTEKEITFINDLK